jgi:hypothetical protein
MKIKLGEEFNEDDEPVLKKGSFSRVSSIPPAYLPFMNI